MHHAQLALVPDGMYLLPGTCNAADELRTPKKYDCAGQTSLTQTILNRGHHMCCSWLCLQILLWMFCHNRRACKAAVQFISENTVCMIYQSRGTQSCSSDLIRRHCCPVLSCLLLLPLPRFTAQCTVYAPAQLKHLSQEDCRG